MLRKVQQQPKPLTAREINRALDGGATVYWTGKPFQTSPASKARVINARGVKGQLQVKCLSTGNWFTADPKDQIEIIGGKS